MGGAYPIGLLRFGKSKGSEAKWQRLALTAIDKIFWINRIRVRVTGKDNIPDGAVIFAANHESYIDGFLVFAAARRPLIAVTAPIRSFPSLLTLWFRRMGYVGVARDLFEDLRYKDATPRTSAIAEASQSFANGASLLICPEGRREFDHHLLPFHTGVARLAESTGALVVPATINGADIFMPTGTFLLGPAKLSVSFGKPLDLSRNKLNVFDDTMLLEKKIARRLPDAYVKRQSFPHHPKGGRAAFFDLDGTLSRRNLYTTMVSRYLHEKRDGKTTEDVVRLIAKRIFLSHGSFFVQAISLMRGMHPEDFTDGFVDYLAKYKEQLFYLSLLELVEDHRSHGNKLFLISSEPDEFLAPIGEFLGLETHGTKVHRRPDGTFTGQMAGPIMRGEQKHTRVLELARKHKIDLTKSFAYGNSWDDYPMLSAVSHAYLVNPEHSLKRRGEKRGMYILHQR